MLTSAIVVLWGLLAITVISAVGRWCRSHPPTRPLPGAVAGPTDRLPG